MATITSNIVSYNSDHSYYAISYYGSTSTSYASVNLTRGSGAETYMYWEFNLSTIPSNAIINSVTCTYKARTSATSTSYIAQATIQLCSNTTVKGSSQSILTTSTDESSFSTSNIGTWTAAELNAGVKLRTDAKRGTSRTSSNYYIYFYGATITVEYTIPSFYIKQNGSWVPVLKAYKKVNGSWTEQTADSTLLEDIDFLIKQ